MSKDAGDAGPPGRTRWDGREWECVARRHYDVASGDELTSHVVLAIADARCVAPHEVTDPPLYDCVDVEALEQFVRGTPPSAPGAPENAVRFDYDGHLVAIHADGHIVVYDPVE